MLEVYTRKICVTVSFPCRLCARIVTQPYTLYARSLHQKDERNNVLTVSSCAGCVLEVYTRKKCVTVSLPCARSLHKKDLRDNFLTVQGARSQLKMCVTASLPCRLCARSLRKRFVTVSFPCRLCPRILHNEDAHEMFLTFQVVCSKFAQKKSATISIP